MDQRERETAVQVGDRELENARAAAVRALLAGIEQEVFPGASAAIGWRGKHVLAQAGRLTYDAQAAAVGPRTIYDCASLTKPVATTTMAMMLADRGWLRLDAAVADYLPDTLDADDPLADERGRITVRHLLAHTSGLPTYAKFYLRARRPEHVLAEAMSLALESKPGARTVYSDVGFILLAELLRRAVARAMAGGGTQPPASLDGFCAREIFAPLGMSSTMFNPPLELKPEIAPTEQDDAFRHRLVQGEVHDENAWVMGGVAGHAGLFSTAQDMAAFCQMMLQEGMWNGARMVRAETVREFTRSQASLSAAPVAGAAPRALGWDKPSAPSSSGKYFSPAAYGHLGFTGTSLWIDPEKQLFVVLLTNRVHPTRDNEAIKQFRPAFHDAILEALGFTVGR